MEIKPKDPECPLSCVVLSGLHPIKVLQVHRSLIHFQSRGEMDFPGNSGPPLANAFKSR